MANFLGWRFGYRSCCITHIPCILLLLTLVVRYPDVVAVVIHYLRLPHALPRIYDRLLPRTRDVTTPARLPHGTLPTYDRCLRPFLFPLRSLHTTHHHCTRLRCCTFTILLPRVYTTVRYVVQYVEFVVYSVIVGYGVCCCYHVRSLLLLLRHSPHFIYVTVRLPFSRLLDYPFYYVTIGPHSTDVPDSHSLLTPVTFTVPLHRVVVDLVLILFPFVVVTDVVLLRFTLISYAICSR